MTYSTNGFNLPDNMIIYPAHDPQILIEVLPDICKVFLRIKIEPLDDGIYQELSYSLKEYNKNIDNHIRMLENSTIKGRTKSILKRIKFKLVKSP